MSCSRPIRFPSSTAQTNLTPLPNTARYSSSTDPIIGNFSRLRLAASSLSAIAHPQALVRDRRGERATVVPVWVRQQNHLAQQIRIEFALMLRQLEAGRLHHADGQARIR